MTDKKQKILIVRLSSLGDILHNIPLANQLKSAGYEVDWIVSEKGFDLIKDNPCVDNAILAPVLKWKKNGFSLISFCEYLKILFGLRQKHYDIAIDTQGIFKTMYWLKFCGAKRRIVVKNAKEFATWGGNELIEPIFHGWKRPNVINYLDFAKHLGINSDEIKYTLPETSKDTKEKVDDFLENIDKTKPLVVIAPATTWRLKHWSKDNWKEVVNYLEGRVNLVFTGGPKDKELLSYIGADRFINLAGKTDLRDLQEIFSRAILVMAPDSGSAHLARATNNPAVISIFTCTPPTLFGPFGDDNKYFSVNGNLDCQPCFTRHCPLEGDKHEQCLTHPSPEEIINIVNKVLQNYKNSV